FRQSSFRRLPRHRSFQASMWSASRHVTWEGVKPKGQGKSTTATRAAAPRSHFTRRGAAKRAYRSSTLRYPWRLRLPEPLRQVGRMSLRSRAARDTLDLFAHQPLHELRKVVV